MKDLLLGTAASFAAPKPAPKPVLPRRSYSISEWCEAEGISRAKYYELKRKGQNPDETRPDGPSGQLVRITEEASRRWHKRFRVKATKKIES
jgi:hypothetical protein